MFCRRKKAPSAKIREAQNPGEPGTEGKRRWEQYTKIYRNKGDWVNGGSQCGLGPWEWKRTRGEEGTLNRKRCVHLLLNNTNKKKTKLRFA